MLWKTHLAFGFLTGILVWTYVNYNFGNKYLFFAFVLIGALWPDMDNPSSKINQKLRVTKVLSLLFKHRGIFHSIWFAVLLPGLIYYFLSKPIGIALFVGYMSHLFIDSFTQAGVNYLHPLGTWHHKGFVQTGTILENLILIGLIIIIILLVLL